MIDGCARGFGAGAGNTQIEVLIAVLNKLGIKTNVDLYKILDCGDIAEKFLVKSIPNQLNKCSIWVIWCFFRFYKTRYKTF